MKPLFSKASRWIAIGCALATVWAATCSTSMAADKLNVIATFGPIYAFTANVAGDAANVKMLLPPNAEPHDFALSPGDLAKLAKADVVVENGLQIESWLENALQSGHAILVVASKGIATDNDNPHVWMDPELAIKEVDNIRAALVKRDPANAKTYNANAAAYTAKLQQLDAEIRNKTEHLASKELVTFHDAFHYFAKRYGLDVAGVLEEVPGQQVNPQELVKLQRTIQEKHVKALFTEPQESAPILRSIADNMKIPIVELDPMEHGDARPDLYESVMREDVKHLTEALGGPAR